MTWMSLTYGSLFSGIEAATVAWHPLGWNPAWFAENDKFPSTVLSHHYPEIPNLGDVTQVDWNGVSLVDLIVFGSPCQSFSVAGRRLGLDDPRGNLALYALRVVEVLQPRWFVFENVPGLLSSGGGRDFAAFLRAVGQCGYRCAWRVLDAQYFGVPQRRRRLFVVGCLGDWRGPAAVLFEPESLSGHPPPSRGETSAVASLTARGVGTCGADDNQAQAGHLIARCLNANERWDGESETFIVNARQDPDTYDRCTGALDTDGSTYAIAMNLRGREGGTMPECSDVASLRAASGGSSRSYVAKDLAVRRLTPVECERLQGFPDSYTLVPYTGGRPAKDTPRYRALGNSMAVPVMHWLGRRIDAVDKIRRSKETPAYA